MTCPESVAPSTASIKATRGDATGLLVAFGFFRLILKKKVRQKRASLKKKNKKDMNLDT